jgi:site-specific DNA-methyltransferase (adenine-specific)
MRVEGVLRRVEGTTFEGCDDEWDNQFTSAAEYEEFTRQWLTQCKRVLKKDGSIWVIGGMQCIYTIGGIMQSLGFWIINDVIWHKKNPTPNFRGTRLNNSHETLIWASPGEKAKYTFNYKTAKELNIDAVSPEEYSRGSRKQLGSVWSIAVCQGRERLRDDSGQKLHSTQKPEELLYRIIAISSSPGDLVLDPFAGTMTTGAVAKRMGRKCIMIEQDPRYCDYGRRRIAKTEEVIGDIENAVFDAKPLRLTFAKMISVGCFAVGEQFYLNNDSLLSATLREDGKLEYLGQVLDIHACAAKALGRKAERINGFDYWYVIRDERLVSIATIREVYRALLKAEG